MEEKEIEKEIEEAIEEFVETRKEKCKGENKVKNVSSDASGGAVYCLGIIGAAIYFISNASGFWMGVLGFLKAIVWPAILVFELLKYLGL
ncbi:MAG: hypothetical protein FD141_1488 [Fusobacteria bacterium]|nr:MAG: hypothetical protein FD141_1488 [Fusobacteriota bacterium]KAF0230201.1 MAG: hypothetical protein FD182_591 [Fusobacteriota bacterium]